MEELEAIKNQRMQVPGPLSGREGAEGGAHLGAGKLAGGGGVSSHCSLGVSAGGPAGSQAEFPRILGGQCSHCLFWRCYAFIWIIVPLDHKCFQNEK